LYILNKSFILDLVVTCYVYNNKLRFTNFRLAIEDNELYINKSIILIKEFSTVLVIVTTLKPKQYTLYLYNIVLILLFYINIALL
jgi:membrane protein YdbS with pleckstrin-like domain